MSGFKEMIAQDIKETFLELDYFGELYTVEGKEIQIVIDTDELKARQGTQDLAVTESSTLFFAATEDLPKGRKPGMNLNINGRECLIDVWEEDAGVTTVALRENIV